MKLVRCEHYKASTNELSEIRRVVRCACKKLGFEESEINLLTLAIDEACTNIIRYAYCGDKTGRIELEVYQSDEDAIFILTDYAKCITPSCLEIKNKELTDPGGLGLKLIYKAMDSVRLISLSDPIGNKLELKKRLPQG
ncbi:MAG: anti-sigma regulatory factor (Ser/Thr protein kinase) [Alteromonadaceae bacterium]|jgi:anti-sigma regulatory factor (Ser/Thr protein kinase)